MMLQVFLPLPVENSTLDLPPANRTAGCVSQGQTGVRETFAGSICSLLRAHFSLCLPTYTYTSQEEDHQFVTSGGLSGPQYHMHCSGRYCCYIPTCNVDSSYSVSRQKLFIKRIFHCVLRPSEGQFLKAEDRN